MSEEWLKDEVRKFFRVEGAVKKGFRLADRVDCPLKEEKKFGKIRKIARD